MLAELSKARFNQESILKQKVRNRWVEQGDINTIFFHSTTRWRRMSSGLIGLHVNGQYCEEPTSIKQHVLGFF